MVRIKHFWPFAMLLTLLALPACQTIPGGPNPVLGEPAVDFTAIRTAIHTRCLDVSRQTADAAELQIVRNDLVTAYMLAADIEYGRYETRLLDEIRSNNFAASLSILTLTAVATVSGNPELARGFSTAAGLVAGGQKAYTTDQLLNQTISVLQQQMRASRAAQRQRILTKLGDAYQTWTFCLALQDAQAYERAGTLNAALAEISATASAARRANEAAADAVVPTVRYTTGPLINALSTYLDPNNSDIQGRVTRALEAMTALGLGPQGDQTPRERLGEIVRDPPFDDQRRQLVAAIIPLERPHNAQAADQLQAALGN